MKSLLTLSHISFHAGKTDILKDVSFSVRTGEVVSIIGVNGAGKSTLLKIIAGILKQTSGTVEKNYKKLAYVPQKLFFDPDFPITVGEFLHIYNQKIEKKAIQKAFGELGSPDLSQKRMGTLSGGELQKVLILSALLSKPDLLLLDEPTAGIDVVGEEHFYKTIAAIKKIYPSLTIILVSHNLHLVYKNSDNVICLHKNNFCCHGSPAELQNNKEVTAIFGNYVLPYEHTPHKKCEHN